MLLLNEYKKATNVVTDNPARKATKLTNTGLECNNSKRHKVN